MVFTSVGVVRVPNAFFFLAEVVDALLVSGLFLLLVLSWARCRRMLAAGLVVGGLTL